MPVRQAIAALALCVLPCVAARADAPQHPPAPPPPPTLELRRPAARPPALEAAVRAAIAETAVAMPGEQTARFGADARTAFARQFGEAKVPYCLHGDGLKRQSTYIFSGYVALPFIFVARARGKCLF